MPRPRNPLPPRLFALDQNFPQPIVAALDAFIPEATLAPIREIDTALAELDDWQVLLALHHDARPWDGLITNDGNILNLPREVAVLLQTNLTLVVAQGAGHDPLKATGLLFAHLDWICRNTDPGRAQVWRLVARNSPAINPWETFSRIASHRKTDVDTLWQEERLTKAELAADPLAL